MEPFYVIKMGEVQLEL